MVSLLPRLLRDDSNTALEQCAVSTLETDINPFLLYLVDTVDERLLKYLAYQFHVIGDEGWNLVDTDEEKRNLIKSAISLHRIKGTKAALEYCLSILGFEGTVSEWYEYGGRVNRFKINVTLTDKSFSEELYDLLLRYVNKFKNKRAKLEEVNITVYPQGECYVFARVVTDEVITIKGVREDE